MFNILKFIRFMSCDRLWVCGGVNFCVIDGVVR
jgi:hypothetical protein